MASAYSDCIRASRGRAKSQDVAIDFGEINRAILARWPAGLEWVKRRAWKLVGSA